MARVPRHARSVAAVVLAAVLAPLSTGSGAAQSEVTIPLRGILPVRCSVATRTVQIDDTAPVVTIRLQIQHECNSRSNLIVGFRSGIPDNVDFDVRVDSAGPSMRNADRATFIEPAPVSAVRLVELRFPQRSRAEVESYLDLLQISVESF